jgi:hypothetical protein
MLPLDLITDKFPHASRGERQMTAGFAQVADTALESLPIGSNDDRDGSVSPQHLRQYADLVAPPVQNHKNSCVTQRRQQAK